MYGILKADCRMPAVSNQCAMARINSSIPISRLVDLLSRMLLSGFKDITTHTLATLAYRHRGLYRRCSKHAFRIGDVPASVAILRKGGRLESRPDQR